jgi:ParB-like chromosome segregation protein Spo0J
VILDQPGGDALWTLVEDENEKPTWQQPTASPEMIAAIAEQLDQELSAANQEYVESLPWIEEGLGRFVAEALDAGYTDIHYDGKVGAIKATIEERDLWFFGEAGVVKVQEGPERTADKINFEEGWFVKSKHDTLSLEGVAVEIEILLRSTGVLLEDESGSKRVFPHWQGMPEEAIKLILEKAQRDFSIGTNIHTVRILWQDDVGGWGLRSEDWARNIIYPGHAAKEIASGANDVLIVGFLSENNIDDGDVKWGFNWRNFVRIWLAVIETIQGEEIHPDQRREILDELDELGLDVYELMPVSENGDRETPTMLEID